MHIAFLCPSWPLEKFQNGVITYVHWMKRALEGQGHRVSVFTMELDPVGAATGIYQVRRRFTNRLIRRLSRGHLSMERSIFDFSSEIAAAILCVHRRDPIDVLEMEETFGWFADVASRTSLPTVVRLHGPACMSLVEHQAQTTFGRARIEREGWALARAEAIVSPAMVTLNRTVAWYGLHPKLTRIIVNPLTMDYDTPLWRLDACDRNTMLFVGRFDFLKGADVALKAFLLVLRRRPNLKLVFVGPDSGLLQKDGTTIQFESFRNSIFPDELRASVDFRGRMPHNEIAKLRTRCMLTIVASRWENQSYALLEPMFQGCPVVSTDAGGCPELVTHGVSGRLAVSGDPDDFAAQLDAILEDPARAESMGRAARAYVMRQHSLAAVASASLEVYKNLLTQSRH